MVPATPLSFDEYRALVEVSPVMIWRAGLDAKCNYFNETWLAFTGRTLEQEAGDGWAEGVHPDDLTRCLDIFLGHFERLQPFELEYRLRRHDGVYRWLFDRGVPYHDEGGHFLGYIGSCSDIEDRRRGEAQRRTTLSMVAHELRTPLAALQTYLDVIQMKASASVAPTMFDRVARQVQRFARLIDDLSDTVKLGDGGNLTVAKVATDLGEIARAVATTYADVLPRRPGSLTFEAVIDDGSFPLLADPSRIEQVLVNIIENAWKFSEPGGVVTLRLAAVGDGMRLSVVDRGIGISPAELAQVTRPHFRGSNASSAKYPGAGMGLAIASDLVVQHGGSLTIESQLGGGTTVVIVLPKAAP